MKKDERVLCAVCKKPLAHPYARYRTEGQDDEVCSRTCDKEYNRRDQYGDQLLHP